jgi:hypothetical protein
MKLRTAARVGASAASAVLLALLLDRPGQTRSAAGAPDVDPKALAVLQAMDDAFARAEGMTATYQSETLLATGRSAMTEVMTLRLGRPNLYDLRIKAGTRERVIASDGTHRFEFTTGAAAGCRTWDVAPRNETREIMTFNPVYWSFFDLGEWQIRSALLGHWSTKWRMNDPGLRSLKYLGRETVDGVVVDRVEWTYTIGYNKPDDDPLYTSVLAIGPDHLVRRIETSSVGGRVAQARRTVETITDLQATPARRWPRSRWRCRPARSARG